MGTVSVIGLRDDAALAGVRPHPVRGIDADVRVEPRLPAGHLGLALGIVVDAHAAERGLAVGPVEQHFRGALEVILQLRHELALPPRIPLQRHVQVEQQQRVGGRHGQRLHAGLVTVYAIQAVAVGVALVW